MISVNNDSKNRQINKLDIPYYPLISIITPTFNHEKFIGTCIESVLKQTYPNWEMIIIDDGSTDKTGSIISSYQDNRIKYVKQENVGIWKLKETYNKALYMSKGDLIAILEGDDAWPRYKLEEQIKIFENSDVIFSWGRKNTINDKNRIIAFDLTSLKPFKKISQIEIVHKLIVANFIQPCTVMIDKKALLSLGGFVQNENTPYIDYPTFLELSIKGRFCPSDRVLGYWRKHKAQVTTEKETEMNEGFMVSLDFFRKLKPTLKNDLNFDSEEKLEFRDKIVRDQLAVSARMALIKGNWNEAINYYKNNFKKGNLKIRIQSILGIISALIKKDLEWFAVITCKPKIRDVSGEWDTTIFREDYKFSVAFQIQFGFIRLISSIWPERYVNSKYLIEEDI
ncbi:MAG TPA: glycosyltransferase family A protein [Methanobacterium sp.]|nr:glycosyltransferase family A protein [Methanobacterium sp.]